MTRLSEFTTEIEGFAERVLSFVRLELQCGCPEGVFDQIRLLRGEATMAGARQMLIVGERLLVVFADEGRSEQAGKAVTDLIHAGLQVREALGLNRLRVVLSDAVTPDQRRRIDAELEKTDDRVHVHYV